MNSVTIDISKNPKSGVQTDNGGGYYYESNSGRVDLTDDWYPDPEGTYRKFVHTLKDGKIGNINNGGTPQNGFGTLTTYTSVSVYYWSRDNSFSNPLLIQLGTGDNEYYASADGTSWAKDHEASTSKLRDSLNKQNCGKNNAHIIKISEKSSGGYKCPMCSKDIQLSYQNQSGYDHYRHTISDSFSVTSFRDGNDWQLGLPSLRDISHIQVYCDSTSRGKLLLIYYDHGGHNWFKRNTSTENTWSGFPNDKVLELLNSDNYYPKITIKLSTSAGKSYSDNGILITMRSSHIGDGYRKHEHSLCGGLFELNGITHKNVPLTDIKSTSLLLSISAYYYGENLTGEKNLLLVELRSSGRGTTYNYYQRITKDAKNWTQLPITEKETDQLTGNNLRTELDRLKKEHFPTTHTNPQHVPSSKPSHPKPEETENSTDMESPATHSSNVANPSSSEPKLNNSTSAKSASLIGSAVGGAVYALVAAVVIVLLVKFWPRIRTKFVKI
ncbi:hypothetical protein BEWA_047310 [Theileria equi strain WA]|uniref:Uncharacterized protein n=1 Tax=Theileria equi strain WA TaxID=1537102 RepID=L1LAE2_THEEQ|nr:hypothetical protein BEWA_047310 [Theileria equi strain WA]EKX72266.1 hypothetical protein BEWA_047310 [Theileria equi strain WA]|eukprot:XP_004831718.1 hypothetical protein BEWA_047310 [Theileria equi strain WA]